MKVGIVIYSDDSETVWNAFRFGNFALASGDLVKVFLIGKGVELESLATDKFNITEQVQTFIKTGGKIFACGVCIEIHGVKPTGTYTVSSLKDLYEIVKESNRVVTF